MSSRSSMFYSRFSSFAEYQAFEARNVPLDLKLVPAVPTFQASLYRSGELSASYFLKGSHARVNPPSRAVSVTTDRLSFKSVQKIRRATENSISPWKSFVTLSFNPSLSQPDERGYVNQSWAKGQLIRFRQALTKKVSRQINAKLRHDSTIDEARYRSENSFRFIWVAECQKNGNIHFHFMFNKYFSASYLRGLWKQGNAAVNCQNIKNASHAAAYICKYITKEEDGRNKEKSTISGNRYNISQQLREDAKPMKRHIYDEQAIEAKRMLKDLTQRIEENGGRVIDSGFGLVIPRPRHSVSYKDKKTGTFKKTRPVNDFLTPVFFPCPF